MKKQLSTYCPDWNDGVLSYEETHLPLTSEKIVAILRNPNCTYQDCNALYFSLLNGDATLWVEYSDLVIARMGTAK